MNARYISPGGRPVRNQQGEHGHQVPPAQREAVTARSSESGYGSPYRAADRRKNMPERVENQRSISGQPRGRTRRPRTQGRAEPGEAGTPGRGRDCIPFERRSNDPSRLIALRVSPTTHPALRIRVAASMEGELGLRGNGFLPCRTQGRID